MRWRVAPFALFALAGCSETAVQNPVECQQRLVAVRTTQLLDPALPADIGMGFTQLADGYAALDRNGCSEAQIRRIAQFEVLARQLSKLAVNAVKADRTAAARNSRLPNSDANIELMTALQDYETKLAASRRELRAMQTDQQ